MHHQKKPLPNRSLARRSVVALWLTAAAAIGAGVTLAVKRLSFPESGGAPGPDEPARQVTFHKDIAPIIFNHCSGCHHPGEAAPFDLLTYADVKKRARQIADMTARRLMPPWLPEPGYGEFVGQRLLKAEQIRLIQRWVEQGASEGNAGDAPPPVWRDGWQLGPPDLVVQLPQPYTLASEGRDVYRNFVIPVPIRERRYVKAVELLPGNAKAVHHAFILIDPTRDSRRRDSQDTEPGFPGLHGPPTAQRPAGHFLSWQPGKMPTTDDEDLAWALEKDTDLVLQMHLRPTGKPEMIQPSVGLHFTNRRPTKRPFKLGLWTHAIDIPPGVANHLVQETYVTPVDLDVLRVLPHAHYLGKQLHGLATLPDGTRQWLVRIPEWDFNWQGDYTFVRPIFLPKGTTILMSYTFDNSTNNVRNPNQPPQRVKYGVNSSDEMAELWLQVLPRNAGDAAILEKDIQPRIFNSTLSYNRYLLGLEPNNAKAHTEIGKAHLFLDQPDEAVPYLRRAIELAPNDDEPRYFLGLLFRLGGRLAEAKAEFQTAIRVNPDNSKAHGNLGLILLGEGHLAEAELHLQSALRINPDDALARTTLDSIVKAREAGKTD